MSATCITVEKSANNTRSSVVQLTPSRARSENTINCTESVKQESEHSEESNPFRLHQNTNSPPVIRRSNSTPNCAQQSHCKTLFFEKTGLAVELANEWFRHICFLIARIGYSRSQSQTGSASCHSVSPFTTNVIPETCSYQRRPSKMLASDPVILRDVDALLSGTAVVDSNDYFSWVSECVELEPIWSIESEVELRQSIVEVISRAHPSNSSIVLENMFVVEIQAWANSDLDDQTQGFTW